MLLLATHHHTHCLQIELRVGGSTRRQNSKKSHEYPQFRDKHIEGVSKQPGEMVGIKTHDKCTPLWDSSIEKDRHHL